MLYSFLISLVDQFSALNVFRYLTFRTGVSVISSMVIVFVIGGPFIRFIESHKITGPIRDDGPISHIIKKVGTPTMGGLLFLIGILFSTLLWADLNNSYIWVLLMVSTSFGLFLKMYLYKLHLNMWSSNCDIVSAESEFSLNLYSKKICLYTHQVLLKNGVADRVISDDNCKKFNYNYVELKCQGERS